MDNAYSLAAASKHVASEDTIARRSEGQTSSWWCKQGIDLLVEGPGLAEGGKSFSFPQPFLRIGRTDGFELSLDSEQDSNCSLYLHRIGGAVFFFDLVDNTNLRHCDALTQHGWLTPDEPLCSGAFKIYVRDVAETPSVNPLERVAPADDRLLPVELILTSADSRIVRRSISRALTVLGSDSPSNLQISGVSIQRVHTALYRTGRNLWAVDLTGNGLWMDQRRCLAGPIHKGTVCRIGELEVRAELKSNPSNPTRPSIPPVLPERANTAEETNGSVTDPSPDDSRAYSTSASSVSLLHDADKSTDNGGASTAETSVDLGRQQALYLGRIRELERLLDRTNHCLADSKQESQELAARLAENEEQHRQQLAAKKADLASLVQARAQVQKQCDQLKEERSGLTELTDRQQREQADLRHELQTARQRLEELEGLHERRLEENEQVRQEQQRLQARLEQVIKQSTRELAETRVRSEQLSSKLRGENDQRSIQLDDARQTIHRLDAELAEANASIERLSRDASRRAAEFDRDLAAAEAKVKSAAASAQQALADAVAERDNLRKQVAQFERSSTHRVQTQRRDSKRRHKALTAERDALRKQLHASNEQLALIRAELDELEDSRAQELQRVASSEAEVNEKLQAWSAERNCLIAERDKLSGEHTRYRTEIERMRQLLIEQFQRERELNSTLIDLHDKYQQNVSERIMEVKQSNDVLENADVGAINHFQRLLETRQRELEQQFAESVAALEQQCNERIAEERQKAEHLVDSVLESSNEVQGEQSMLVAEMNRVQCKKQRFAVALQAARELEHDLRTELVGAQMKHDETLTQVKLAMLALANTSSVPWKLQFDSADSQAEDNSAAGETHDAESNSDQPEG